MSNINILHISDLHFQNGNDKQQEFIGRFLKDINSNPLKNLCKFVVFSGDLVMEPSEINYNTVKADFIEPLMKILHLPIDHFFLVPGNHDCNRKEIESNNRNADSFSALISEYFSTGGNSSQQNVDSIKTHLHHKFDMFLSFHNKLYSDHLSTDIQHFIYEFNSAHIYTYSSNKIGIACINSSLTCYGSSSHEVEKIYIGKEQIEFLFRKIKECSIRIAVFHHLLDGSDILSRDDVRSYLYENFHVILTGHTHTERSYSIAQNNEEVFYNISSCLYSDDYNRETIYDPSYSFVEIDCEDLNGTIFFRKYYAMRKEFDKDLRMYSHGKSSFSLRKNDQSILVKSEKTFSILKKPTLTQSSGSAFEKLDEEKSGYNIDYKGRTFRDQCQMNSDFSMFSLRNSHFYGCTFDSCLFTNTILIDASFEDCHFSNVRFISIDHYYTVEFSTENGLIAVAGEGGVVVILKLNISNESPSESFFSTESFLYGVEGKIRSLSWRNDGTYIAAADQMGYIYIWKIDQSSPIYKKQIGTTPIYAVKWSPTGEYLASTDESGYKIYIHRFFFSGDDALLKNIITLYEAEHSDRHYQQILDCAWSNNGRWLATVGIDRNICVWDMENLNKPVSSSFLKCSKRNIHSDYIRKVIWSDNSDELLTCSDDGVIKRWFFNPNFSDTIRPKQEICVKPREGNNEVLSLVWYSDQFIFAGLRDDDYAIIEQLEDNLVVVKTQKAHKGRIWDMSVDRKHHIIFTVGNGTITAWSFNSTEKTLISLCSYESKLLCTGMKFIKCDGLDSGAYLVAKNKDIPEKCEKGTLLDFLLTKGAFVYPTITRKD